MGQVLPATRTGPPLPWGTDQISQLDEAETELEELRTQPDQIRQNIMSAGGGS